MSAEIQVKEDEYWAGYIQAMRERLACYDGRHRQHRLVEMLQGGLARELATLDAFSDGDALSYAAELLAAWQQIIEEMTA